MNQIEKQLEQPDFSDTTDLTSADESQSKDTAQLE